MNMFKKSFVFVVLSMTIIFAHADNTPAVPRIAIIVNQYHKEVTDKLLEVAFSCLLNNGIESKNVLLAYVPESSEIPLIVQWLAQLKQYDAFITLDALIKNSTPHWSTISDQVARGIAQVSLDYNVPVIWGVLVTDSVEEALTQAALLEKNRGWEAASAAIAMCMVAQEVQVLKVTSSSQNK